MDRLSITCLVLILLGWATTVRAESDLERARGKHAEALGQLDDILVAARRAHADGVQAAHQRLLAAYDRAIRQARRDEDAPSLERLELQRARLAAEVPRPLATLRGRGVFESVLGVYGRANRGPRHPFVNLRPPNADLWSPAIQKRLNGRLSFESIDYVGTALLVIPTTGWYRVDLPARGTRFALNGRVLGAGDVELQRGVYDVEIFTSTWGQPYLPAARAVVTDSKSGRRVPFVNTAVAIELFLARRINGRRVEEVSGFKTRPIDTRVSGPKGRVLSPKPQPAAPRPPADSRLRFAPLRPRL